MTSEFFVFSLSYGGHRHSLFIHVSHCICAEKSTVRYWVEYSSVKYFFISFSLKSKTQKPIHMFVWPVKYLAECWFLMTDENECYSFFHSICNKFNVSICEIMLIFCLNRFSNRNRNMYLNSFWSVFMWFQVLGFNPIETIIDTQNCSVALCVFHRR